MRSFPVTSRDRRVSDTGQQEGADMTTTHTPAATTTTRVPTRTLLGCVAVAGPLWAVLSVAQAATREGFDITRHPLSALANGSPGWLQVANFIVAGVLTVAGASGLRRVLHGTRGGTWAPRLVRGYGLAMIAAGLLRMDPGAGFPAGTPDTVPTSMSWHSYGHMAAGTVAFACLITACYVLGSHYRRAGNRRDAALSRSAGTALLAGDLWASGGGTAGSLTLAVGAIAAMVWISVVAARYRRAAR
jgi:hypothetical protein